MKPTPFKHQEECFERFKDAPYVAILAEMGTGKSRMVLDIVEHKVKQGLHDRMIIIAPVAVGPQWHEEQLPTHLDIPYQSYVYRSGNSARDKLKQEKFFKDCQKDPQLKIYIINFEAFVKRKGNQLIEQYIMPTTNKPPIFVIDEASRIKNPDAKSVRNIMQMRARYPDSFRAVLTGTPAAKSPVDMYSIFDFLKPNYMGCSYMAFKAYHEIEYNMSIKVKKRLVTVRSTLDPQTYLKIKKWIDHNAQNEKNINFIMQKYGLSLQDYRQIANSNEFIRFKHVDKLQEYIAKDTYAVSKVDCLDLPEKVYQVVQLEMNAEQKKQIKQLASYSATFYQGETLTISTKALLGIRVLQICGGNLPVHTEKEGEFKTVPIAGTNAKLNYIVDDLQEAGEQQAIVWACFVPEIEMLTRELGKKFSVVGMHGGTPKSQRPELIRRFKAGEARLLIAHPAVGGYGLNLQNAGLQYWYSRDFRTEARLQAEDRSHRIGTLRSPIYKDLVYNSAFERNVLEVLKEGADMNARFVTTELNDLFKIE